jgi:hypothetical protein
VRTWLPTCAIAALCWRKEHHGGQPIWWLEPGGPVEATAAAAPVASYRVIPAGNALFPDLGAQTFLFVPQPKLTVDTSWPTTNPKLEQGVGSLALMVHFSLGMEV